MSREDLSWVYSVRPVERIVSPLVKTPGREEMCLPSTLCAVVDCCLESVAGKALPEDAGREGYVAGFPKGRVRLWVISMVFGYVSLTLRLLRPGSVRHFCEC